MNRRFFSGEERRTAGVRRYVLSFNKIFFECRISNKEYRMMKWLANTSTFDIPCSIFIIQMNEYLMTVSEGAKNAFPYRQHSFETLFLLQEEDLSSNRASRKHVRRRVRPGD